MINKITPSIQYQYVKLMMAIISRGIANATKVDPEINLEMRGFPEGYVLGMNVFHSNLGFKLKFLTEGLVELLPTDTEIESDLTITFKHLAHAFAVFSFQESTAQAFANDRMIADGDLAYAIRFVRCLNRMESIILPKAVASLAVKDYPENLSIRTKVSSAGKIYLKTALSFIP